MEAPDGTTATANSFHTRDTLEWPGVAEQVCGHLPRNLALPWQAFNDVFALVERAMAMTLPARHRMNSNLQPVDLGRYHSVLIRKPFSRDLHYDNEELTTPRRPLRYHGKQNGLFATVLPENVK
jgi:hypothetical protein